MWQRVYGANPVSEFVFELGDTVAQRFAQVLMICDRQGLIWREMFANDDAKPPFRNLCRCAKGMNFATLQCATATKKQVDSNPVTWND